MHKVAIIGAPGFTGAELLRICATHPDFEVIAATGETQAGNRIADLYPSLAGVYGDLAYVPSGDEPVLTPTWCSSACPTVPASRSCRASAARSTTSSTLHPTFDSMILRSTRRGTAMSTPHRPRRFPATAFPNCSVPNSPAPNWSLCLRYPTTAVLALSPLLKAGVIEATGLIVDAATGVSGAGRPPKPHTTFCAVDEDFSAYGLLNHRHTPEMEMVLRQYAGVDASLIFTPHLAPMNRGILATCYARPTGQFTTEDVLAVLHDAYDAEPFIVVSERPPSTKATLGSNSCHLTARVDPRTGWVMVLSALDNLVKGASGGAVQCANLALGLPEETGLTVAGTCP